MTYQKYLEAEQIINEGLIRVGISKEREKTGPKDPRARMAEMKSFLKALGNPQAGIPAVHVAGTSGKGSVSAAIAGLLTEAGLKVGLHISPYLQSATEKIWIQDKFVSSGEFHSLVEWVQPESQRRLRPDTPASIHGMASVAIAYEAFRRASVDVMVYEAGCGARFDLTSFVDTKVAVITNVGMDHIISLGPSIEDIAWHKAGVARAGAPLISGATGSAAEVVRQEATSLGCELVEIPPQADALDHNRQIAIRAAAKMCEQFSIELNQSTIDRGLHRVKLAARSERMPSSQNRCVILDGAHNGPKIQVAIQSALKTFTRRPYVAIVGFLGSKASSDLVKPLAGQFDQVIATEPRVYAKTPFPAEQTGQLIKEVGYWPIVEPDPLIALKKGLELTSEGGSILACGSFYLVGELRERWYPKNRVVMGRTSWPDLAQD